MQITISDWRRYYPFDVLSVQADFERINADAFIQLDPPPSQPLHLIANLQTFDYLDEYHDLEDLGLDDTSYVRKIHSADISTSTNIPWRERLNFSSEGLSERIRM